MYRIVWIVEVINERLPGVIIDGEMYDLSVCNE